MLANYIWCIRKFGLRRFIRYERARRKGATIDYTEVFTPQEMQILFDHDLLPTRMNGSHPDETNTTTTNT